MSARDWLLTLGCAAILAWLMLRAFEPVTPAQCEDRCRPWVAVGIHGTLNTVCDCAPRRTCP